jgi:hypothetical protein
MNDEILKRLDARLDRRSFLRGSGLVAAAMLGVSVASPLVAFAQTQDKTRADKPEADKKDEPEKKDKDKDAAEDEDPTKVTRSTPRVTNTASAHSAATTCIARAAPGRAKTAATPTSNRRRPGQPAIRNATRRDQSL